MDLQPFLMIIHTVSIDIPDRIMTLKLNLIIIIHFFIIFADSSFATQKSSQEWVDQSLHSIKRHINLNGIDMSIVSHIRSYHQWACDKWNDIRTAMIESEDNTFSTWQKIFSSAFKTVSLLSKFTSLPSFCVVVTHPTAFNSIRGNNWFMSPIKNRYSKN